MTRANIGIELKRLRRCAEMSQNDLSVESDVTLSFIKAIELDNRQPTVTTVFKLAKALNVTPDKLIMPGWTQWKKTQENE